MTSMDKHNLIWPIMQYAPRMSNYYKKQIWDTMRDSRRVSGTIVFMRIVFVEIFLFIFASWCLWSAVTGPGMVS